MDRNRLLITGLSVAVFLTAVVVFGLLWFYPKPDQQPADDVMSSVQFDPFAYIDGDMPVPSGDEQETVPTEVEVPEQPDMLPGEGDYSEATPGEMTEDGITIVFGNRDRRRRIAPSAESERADPVTEVAVQPEPETDPTPEPRQPAPEPRQPAPEPRQPVPAEEPSRPSISERTPSAEPTPDPRASQEYWIQVFAGSSRSNVELARDRFVEETSLRPLITTIHHEGDLFYRLRIGPYHTRNEAEKLVGDLAGKTSFTQPYISVVYN